jgi:hypothetical protein
MPGATGTTWSRLPKNGAIVQTIAINQWWEFDRNAELSAIQRDRNVGFPFSCTYSPSSKALLQSVLILISKLT